MVHFKFYKGTEKVQEEEIIGAGQLNDGILYYGDCDAATLLATTRTLATRDGSMRKEKDEDVLGVKNIRETKHYFLHNECHWWVINSKFYD